MSRSRASAGVEEARISAITASRLSSAMRRPSRMWSRSSALRRSKIVRRVTTSRRWSRNTASASRRFRSLGRPSTIASRFTPKDSCIGVSLNSWFRITWAEASFFSSTTIRMPDRSDSSRKSEMPSIFFSLTSSAIRSMSRALFTWYGIASTMIFDRPVRSSSSISALAFIWMMPRPVVYASRIGPVPQMNAPVGKSGPGMWRIRSSGPNVGSSMSATHPSTSSPRLCGGTFVAMPTAMPAAPFSSRFGIFAGRTVGSRSLSS